VSVHKLTILLRPPGSPLHLEGVSLIMPLGSLPQGFGLSGYKDIAGLLKRMRRNQVVCDAIHALPPGFSGLHYLFPPILFQDIIVINQCSLQPSEPAEIWCL